MNTYKILAISGSLRKDSYNTALIHAFKDRAPEGVTVEIADFSTFGMYSQDRDASFPQDVIDLKAKIRAADGILISTPEYNRSMPGVLKNMIDWASRPWGDSAWNGKPVFIVGATIAPTGTALAQYHLKQVLNYLNMRVMGQPEFYLSEANAKFDADGTLTHEDTIKHVDSGWTAFTTFIEIFRSN